MSTERQTSPTLVLHKVRQVLDCFVPNNQALTLTNLQRSTGFPMSTTKRLLESLLAEGFLSRNERGYQLGPDMIVWAQAVKRGSDIVQVSKQVLEQIRDTCGETVTLNVRNGSRRVCIDRVSSVHRVKYDALVGEIIPLQAGSSCKVMLAFEPTIAAEVIANGLEKFTDQTITDPDEYSKALDEVRHQGYAISCDETAVGVSSIAAPVFNSEGRIIAAIGIGGPSFRCTRDWLEDQVDLIRGGGAKLSGMLGGNYDEIGDWNA